MKYLKIVLIVISLSMILCMSAVSATNNVDIGENNVLNTTDVDLNQNGKKLNINATQISLENEPTDISPSVSESNLDNNTNNAIDTFSLPVISKGSLLPKCSDDMGEICDDGYHVSIDENTYNLIQLDGSSFIVHKENINSYDQLKSFFKKISNHKIQWDIVIINLAKKTYNVDFSNYADREWDYALNFHYGQLIINGNGSTFAGKGSLNFMNICNGANVVIDGLTLKNFNHCFFNQGMLRCSNINFIENEAYKFDVGIEGSGAVIHNFNIAEFVDCTFNANNAKYFGLLKQHQAGGILYAEPYSTTYFYHNNYVTKDFQEDSIFACKYSSIIITPKDGNTDWTWNNFIGNSFIHPLASITMINPKETIINDYYGNNYNPLVFNCSDTNELFNALKLINKEGIMGSEVIINLKANAYYIFNTKQANQIMKDIGEQYRGSFFNCKYESYKDYPCDRQYYLINQGFIPITINGNGAEIKMNDNKDSDDYHFAFIGNNGKLTLNNLTLSHFNTAFVNAKGNLICDNCDFYDNKIKYKIYDGDMGGVLRSFGGSSIFNFCYINNNLAGTKNTAFAYATEGSYMEINNCKFVQSESKYVTLIDSTIKCSEDLYKNHISSSSTTFINSDSPNLPLTYYLINNVNDFNDVEVSKNLGDIYFIDFKCNCTVNLNKIISKPGSIYIKSNGNNVKINSDLNIGKNTLVCLDGFTIDNKIFTNNGELSLMNCVIKNCNSETMFKNNGQCSLSGCIISNNDCKNVFENKGSMTIMNSFINNNKASKYGIFYNNGGSVVCFNSTFSKNDGKDIYNFRTSNCAVINSTCPNVIFKEPLSGVKLDLIKSAFFIGTAIVSGGCGYAIGACLGPCIAGSLLSAICGAGVGACFGLGYGAIESYIFHDYSHLWSNVGSFAFIGVSFGMLGFGLSNMKSVDSKINDLDEDISVKSTQVEEGDVESNDIFNMGNEVDVESNDIFNMGNEVDVDPENPMVKWGNKIADEICKHRVIKYDYENLINELENEVPSVDKFNEYTKRLCNYFENNNLQELGHDTFNYLKIKCMGKWQIPISNHNQILVRLNDYVYLFSE